MNIVLVNNLINTYVSNLEKELYKQFHKDYAFWDSIINIILSYDTHRSEINGMYINIIEYESKNYFYLTIDDIWSSKGGTMNDDYIETIIKVLNKKE